MRHRKNYFIRKSMLIIRTLASGLRNLFYDTHLWIIGESLLNRKKIAAELISSEYFKQRFNISLYASPITSVRESLQTLEKKYRNRKPTP